MNQFYRKRKCKNVKCLNKEKNEELPMFFFWWFFSL